MNMENDLIKIPAYGAAAAFAGATGRLFIEKAFLGNSTTYLGYSVALVPSIAEVALFGTFALAATMVTMIALHQFRIINASDPENFLNYLTVGYTVSTLGTFAAGLISEVAFSTLVISFSLGSIPLIIPVLYVATHYDDFHWFQLEDLGT